MSLVTSPLLASSDCPRRSANYHPSIWGDHFIQYASQSLEVPDKMEVQSKMLKEEVRKMLALPTKNLVAKMNLIDSIQRLGVSYHFEREIDDILQQTHDTYVENGVITLEEDLHTLALLFRLLRQHGHRLLPDVFEKFKDEQGNIREGLTSDVEGMMSLYEAAHLRVQGEDILDEALAFTSAHLESMIIHLNPSVAAKVKHSLRHPLRKNLPRLEACRYISSYQNDPSHHETLLAFAKLDFNMLQKLHQTELGNISKWWKKLDFVTKVPFARDRLVEGYFWPLGVYYEPQYIMGRTIVGKLIAVTSAVDDTYDAYGTLEELELFTEAIRRWDASPLDAVPECMKVVFHALLDLFNEMESLTAKEGKSCFVPYVKQTFQKLGEAYLVEAKWCNQGYIPTYEEYLENGVVTSCYPLLEIASFLGLANFATKHVFDWISNVPRIVRASAIICRLTDDLSSHKFERKRVHVASAVECLMKQHGISEEEAYQILEKELDNAWKDINEECMKAEGGVPKVVLDCVVNFSSVIELVYGKYADKYTHAELLKDHVAALVVDPVLNLQIK